MGGLRRTVARKREETRTQVNAISQKPGRRFQKGWGVVLGLPD